MTLTPGKAMMKKRLRILAHTLTLIIICSITQGCATSVEQAPTAQQNRLLQMCNNLLMATNETLALHGAKLPKRVKQRLGTLLAAAEISNQFEEYPTCVDRLERARYFLAQAEIMLPRQIGKMPLTTSH